MTHHFEGDDKVITATQAPEKYLEIFEQLKARTAGQFGWLQNQRQEAFARFAETGFPTTHDEDWRFTSVAAVANTQFELGARAKIDERQLEAFGVSDFACRLVFVNGHFVSELSRLPDLSKGVWVRNLGRDIDSAE